MPSFPRMRRAWNAFIGNEDVGDLDPFSHGVSYATSSPSNPRRKYTNERTIVASVYTRIGIDVADVEYRHVQLNDEGRYETDFESQLNKCLTVEPNLDQGPRAFRQDIVLTLFDKGVAAVVPVDTWQDPSTGEAVDVISMRVGEIIRWGAQHVRVSVYNEKIGKRQEVTLPKRSVAIIENPLYMVMNEPNSTYQRLIRKLNLLDAVDEQSSSGKLDLIIQLPYVIKTESKREQANKRREEIEMQLKGSQYGIAYADGTEKITQLNRPAENNLLKQVQYLIDMFYSQLGITPEVMNGTADEATMLNYLNRTVEPIVQAIVEAMQRSFLGRKRTDEMERILYFKDPFKLVPLSQIADIADKLTRNEILTSNDIRGFLGVKPSNDPKADELRNSNMPRTDTERPVT